MRERRISHFNEKGFISTAPYKSWITEETFFDLYILFLKKETVKTSL